MDAYTDPNTDEPLILLGGHVGVSPQNTMDFAAFRLCEDGQFDDGISCGGDGFGDGADGKRIIDVTGTNDAAYGMLRQPDDGYIVLVGDTDGDSTVAGEILIARLEPDGDALDTAFGGGDGIVERKFEGNFEINRARAVARLSDGTYAVAGFTAEEEMAGEPTRMYVGRFDSEGDVIDEIRSEFINPAGHADQAQGVVVDSQDRIVAGGFHSHSGAEGFDPIPFNVVRFAAIRVLEPTESPPAPPGGPHGSGRLGQLQTQVTATIRWTDPSAPAGSAQAMDAAESGDRPSAVLLRKKAATQTVVLSDIAFGRELLNDLTTDAFLRLEPEDVVGIVSQVALA